MLSREASNPDYVWSLAEGVGIEPTGDNAIAPLTALKAGTATRQHPLPL